MGLYLKPRDSIPKLVTLKPGILNYMNLTLNPLPSLPAIWKVCLEVSVRVTMMDTGWLVPNWHDWEEDVTLLDGRWLVSNWEDWEEDGDWRITWQRLHGIRIKNNQNLCSRTSNLDLFPAFLGSMTREYQYIFITFVPTSLKVIVYIHTYKRDGGKFSLFEHCKVSSPVRFVEDTGT